MGNYLFFPSILVYLHLKIKDVLGPWFLSCSSSPAGQTHGSYDNKFLHELFDSCRDA